MDIFGQEILDFVRQAYIDDALHFSDVQTDRKILGLSLWQKCQHVWCNYYWPVIETSILFLCRKICVRVVEKEKFSSSLKKSNTRKYQNKYNWFKNGLTLPTGQWYAPSAVIYDAWCCMVLHGIAKGCIVLHGIALSCTHTWYLLREPREYLCKFFLAGVNF